MNVVAFQRAGFLPLEAEIIETVAMVLSGKVVELSEMERTREPIDGFVARLGKPDGRLRGFAMPGYRWRHQLECTALQLFVIDQGKERLFFYVPDRK